MKSDRLIIAAYNPIIVSGIKHLLNQNNLKFNIVGEANDIDSLLTLLELQSPDLAVVDIGLTWRSGVDFVEEVEQRNRQVKIVPISVHPIDQHVLSGLKNRFMNQKMTLHEWEQLLRLNPQTAVN